MSTGADTQHGRGAVNAHTHLYSGLAGLGMPRPAAEPACFIDILARVWWRLDRALDEASLRAAARLYLAEARGYGTIGIFDHHESPDFIDGSLEVLADACQELGVAAVLCYGATERNHGRAEALRGLAECRRFCLHNRRSLVRGAIGLHASFTVSDTTIREAGELARELGTVLHMHVAEDEADVQDARQRGYAGVIHRLARLHALVPGSIFAHGVHLTAEEVAWCASAGIWLVHNPRSNAGNRVGYARALGASPLVALGTDGYPADLAAEARALSLHAARADVAGDATEQAIQARMRAGRSLLAQCFGTGEPELEAMLAAAGLAQGALDSERMATIREEAEIQAARLWARMEAL